jgi:curved DNA-binding protein CbpA
MQQEIDLNIANYNLEDLLNLFKLDVDFDLVDLKAVKKKVLKFHPDKSGLDKEYFLFFSNVYTILKNLWTFKNKDISENCKLHRTQISFEEEKEILDNFFENNKNLNFQKWFNEQFEQIYTDQDEQPQSLLPDESLLPYEELDGLSSSSQQTVFQNVNDLKKFRSSQDTSPLSENESLGFLKRRSKKDEKEALELAFKNYQQDQIISQRKQLVFSKQFQTLK